MPTPQQLRRARGLSMIDVAIGLAFCYVTLSLVCSSIQEIIAGVFGLRSRNLKRGIENLVGNEYARALYDHPLIKGLRKPNRLPSYLNAEIFGAALIEVVAQDQASTHAFELTATELRETIAKIDPAIRHAGCCSAWWTRPSRGLASSSSASPNGSTPAWTGSPAGTSGRSSIFCWR